MKRRDFIKYGASGVAALVVGAKMPWLMDNPAYAAVPVTTVNFLITDAIKHMVTDQTLIAGDPMDPGAPNISNPVGNDATCYFWVYKEDHFDLPDCPGPIIFTTTGQRVQFVVTNGLDTPHALAIPRLRFTTGPIAPGATVTKTLIARTAGTYLYYDNLNEPVNRVMGLHGAFIVMPKAAARGHRFTPFDRPPRNTQKLFDDLGNAAWWPGLAWEEGDPATDTPPFRQNIWVLHQASPKLFAAVGNNETITFKTNAGGTITGSARDPQVFTEAFLHSAFTSNDPALPMAGSSHNYVPEYFTISGQSGHFAHNTPWLCPYSRVGEPYLIRILNAGLWLHSTHIHANHVFVLSRNNGFDSFPGSNDNPIWIDLYTANPLDTYEWLIPFMRPPDVPSDLGIGRDDLQKSLDVSTTAVALPGYGIANPLGPPPYLPAEIPAAVAQLTWPPQQEMQMFIPNVGQRIAKALDGVTDIDCAVRLSPVCYPMHDHSEPSQVSQGGNYNCGLISGIVFTGDRKGAKVGQPGTITFPDRPTTGDPMPVVHGPDIRPGQSGTLEAVLPFVMPSLP